jgi:hypothetical protein
MIVGKMAVVSFVKLCRLIDNVGVQVAIVVTIVRTADVGYLNVF